MPVTDDTLPPSRLWREYIEPLQQQLRDAVTEHHSVAELCDEPNPWAKDLRREQELRQSVAKLAYQLGQAAMLMAHETSEGLSARGQLRPASPSRRPA